MTKDDARQFLSRTWAKYKARSELNDLENRAVHVIIEHPEYHTCLHDGAKALKEEFTPERGEINPYLHLSLHIAILEQVAMNFPPGIDSFIKNLEVRYGSRHEAEHQVIDCLAEAIWRANREGAPMDPDAYVAAIGKRLLSN